jgi:hypothetical protein
MKRIFFKRNTQIAGILLGAFGLLQASSSLSAQGAAAGLSSHRPAVDRRIITDANKINPTTVEVLLSDGDRMTFDFYGENIFRLFQDNAGGIVRDPEAMPEARILADNPRKPAMVQVKTEGDLLTISTSQVEIRMNQNNALMSVLNKTTGEVVLEETEPIRFENHKVTLSLKENPDEYFFGGGVQNGRFSHKGKAIAIENQNSWTDGGVASPNPFYWSTRGYGVMWHTFKKGTYDFGAEEKGLVRVRHETDYADVFFLVSDGVVALLNDFYQLTGHPALLPKFAFYQGHLNAYNRDYWTEDENGILFEDGKRYREGRKDGGGVEESLNGEKNNYPFSARAVIDRYKKHDMPLGWLLPNDGYGAGYGQTETLDGNIQNLKSLTDYAHSNGVEIGLWTQSDLHPKPGVEALLQRDLVKEVRDAGVRVLKTDVAWVGAGYSFGLNGVAEAARIMTYYGNNARPFIISLDGWAGTQRYASIWTGDQSGGRWEYIRFHIPTYIGAGLSGIPNISSDMDGIFGGNHPAVNTRDFQWKTFTPLQLNMDGWGTNEKYPHALGEPVASINRGYLKLKSELMPYAYSIAREAVDGLPMIRALFTDDPNPYTLGVATQYQFLYGPYLLVAPIYQATRSDEQGNDVRHNIYLPPGDWIDFFTGDRYEGNCIVNSFDAPLWKLPVFVKAGAIIPMTEPNNHVSEIRQDLRIYEIYPSGYSVFTEYDDDGISEAYRAGAGVATRIESRSDGKGRATITVHPAEGDFPGFVKEKTTIFRINTTGKPRKISTTVGRKPVKLTEVSSMEAFGQRDNVFFYEQAPSRNRFATPGGSAPEWETVVKNPLLHVKLGAVDVTAQSVSLQIDGFTFQPADRQLAKTGPLAPPNARITEENTEAYSLKLDWDATPNADYYEINFNDRRYTMICDTEFLFENLKAETNYTFDLRAVNKDGSSDRTTCSAITRSDPLEFAIRGITGETSVENQGRSLPRLFDFEEGELWHTAYNVNALPFDLIMDLKTINQLDKFQYLPRDNAGNGTILRGTVYTGTDKEQWTEAGTLEWARSNERKPFEFVDKPTARYVKLHITDAVGGFGSGRELYIFKMPGTESYLPGDINNDGRIDANDLTSYRNYTGLRQGDADFEGYISRGDVNRNGLIDAYDISVVATQLEGGVQPRRRDKKVQGSLRISVPKQNYSAGEKIEVTVTGIHLSAVNALSFALPYDPQRYEFDGIEPLPPTAEMENLSNDRLHTNGLKSLYATFVNIGEKEPIGEGTKELFVIRFRAKQNLRFDLNAIDGILVDAALNVQRF